MCDPVIEKAEIRRRFLTERRRLTDDLYRDMSLRAQQALLAENCFAQAGTLALYSAVNKEVATDLLFAVAQQQGKRVLLPRVRGEELEFCEVATLDNLRPGAFGVLEPAGGAVALTELELVIVPGVVFDRRGYRLGYGRGYYDRVLAGVAVDCIPVGLCFSSQLCPQLAAEAHDRKVKYLATDAGFFPCHDVVAGST
ncbi:MAG: 5-formyltetrahydrofolate cyclo-ligase [Desulfuromonas sp.]|nr:MAG: 5-formyltetrahydrofolate cyclo-ligase [Desulfuromonas sp.]